MSNAIDVRVSRDRYHAELDLNKRLMLKRLRDLSLENLALVDRNEKLQDALDASIAREARRSIQDEAVRAASLARLTRTRKEFVA